MNVEFNGCTGWFDGWWRICCDMHDLQYALMFDRQWADLSLAKCVVDTAPDGWVLVAALVALIMFLGVRFFGWIFYYGGKNARL